MIKRYFNFLLFLTAFVFITSGVMAQDGRGGNVGGDEIAVYPNPVVDGKVYVSSDMDRLKYVEVYDVLGKKVLGVQVRSDVAIDVGGLMPGVYIITISEEENIATRKLVVK